MFLCLTVGSSENDPDIPGDKIIVNSERISYVEEMEANRAGVKSLVVLDKHASDTFESIVVFETVEYIASKLQAV